MKPLFEYTDYRLYLRDFIALKRSVNRHYSLRVIADKCGFKARDYVLRIMNGQRNLSRSGAFKLAGGLGFSDKEREYFENLVAFNQASAIKEKQLYYHRMSQVRRYSHVQRLRADQVEYFSQWHHAALRSLLPVIDFADDDTLVGKFMKPPLSAPQVRESIQLLLRIGLLEKLDDGRYRATSPSVTTGDEIRSLALAQFHKSMCALAAESIDNDAPDSRDISGVTMSVSANAFREIKQEIRDFRKRIMALAESDTGEDRVCQLNVHLFPLSKTRGHS